MRRVGWLFWLLLPLCFGFAGAPANQAKLIYCRNGVLYSVPITAAGTLQPGATPRKIAHLPSGTQLDSLSVSADGSLVAYSVRTRGDSNTYTLWLVADRKGAQTKRLGVGYAPVFAPTGRQLACTAVDDVDSGSKSVYILDVTTGKRRLLRPHAYGSSWSADSSEIALIDSPKMDGNCTLMVVDSATGKHVRFHQDSINAHSPLLSPNGRYLAYNPHLSRPKVAGIIADRKTGVSVSLPQRGGQVLDWSADSKRLLWTYYVLDPHNEGNYFWMEVWSTTVPGNRSRPIDTGSNAQFAPDGEHILYFRTEANSDERSLGLYVTDARNHRHKILEHCDEEFAVWKPAPLSNVASLLRR